MGVKKKQGSGRNAERPSVVSRPVIMIRDSGGHSCEPLRKVPKKYLDQALENAIVLGDFERVKKLVEEEGAVPAGKHVKTAMDIGEKRIEKYLETKIAERRGSLAPSMPSDEGWDL